MIKRKLYPLKELAVGSSFYVPKEYDHQHVRVSASEYGRRTGRVFTCRKQEDGGLRVYRVEASQRDIDRRGAASMRVIPQPVVLTVANAVGMPTEQEFSQWLATLPHGSRYTMPPAYRAGYALMATWVVNHALRTAMAYSTSVDVDGALLIFRA